MKLARVGEPGRERAAILDDAGKLRDLGEHFADVDGPALSVASLAALSRLDLDTLPVLPDDTRIGACVGGVGKFLCIGLNYRDHAEEAGMAIPEHPILFLKANSAICGPNDDLVLPRGSTATDWEVELGVVIGTRCKYVSAENALEHVAGYCVINDVSERDFQAKLTGQWTKGKSCDSFGPLGPWLVTTDEVPDPQALTMSCTVNGETRQSGSTETMIFSVAEIISHLSQLMTLHPGDVISTGTPPGVGMGMKPPLYLKAGDVVECEIAGMGRQRQKVVADG
ncbi:MULTISPECIES: fumarylacetoacetate hydrolase family protein [unclassified Sulfitobacter]|uniref:fumarylacetoacetate hydrolase family protein n=1 Tax=unclassified Sulfitobacter TaxID=196795 RepID=UPI0007C3E12F|nr:MULTISPECIES: fumarylacetoacetate hydrolase family protein [unclassified Sulfitobacter]KZX93785.1 2-hydroxyhepta-2,4-diene-1,7-dioate isomerase [Sulfitobacter sp. HI0023]KZY23347.1 2-hydroxyhepta-2,4-diene-1,7-dioate isomerase [Sulfitobacter sp. HI0040]KZZ70525.1 2-hydroxyhepta-2,4-diene-1,7-dioate isomerase [Sulfitobacter sp. HI0129]